MSEPVIVGRNALTVSPWAGKLLLIHTITPGGYRNLIPADEQEVEALIAALEVRLRELKGEER